MLSHLPSYILIPLICGWESENGGGRERFSNRERVLGGGGGKKGWYASSLDSESLSNMTRVSLVLEDIL